MTVTPDTTQEVRLQTAQRSGDCSTSRSPSRDEREILILLAASMLATIPVWLASYPPMVDLPQHAAQISLLRNLHDPAFRFAGLFRVNWFTPYLLGYLAVYILAPLCGIVTACKLVTAAALIGLPVTTALLMRETGADSYWALLTVPAMYGFSYTWGFFNFLVAVPIGLLFLILVIRHVRKPCWRSSLYLGVVSALLFFGHALACVFFGTIACAYAVVETRSLHKAVLALLPSATMVLLILVWYLRTKSDPGTQQAVVWDLGWMRSVDTHALGGRLTGFFPRLLGLRPSLLCFLAGGVLFAIPLLAGARPSKGPAVWVPLCVCVLALLLAPTTAFSGWAISHKFTVFALPFFLMTLQRADVERPALRRAVVFLLIGWIAITSAKVIRYNDEVRGFDEVLSKMEPNERVLSLMFIQFSEVSPAPVFLHFPAWYSAKKHGVVDMNFAVFPIEPVRYNSTVPAPDPSVSEWHPQTFRWTEWRGDTYRYFVVHAQVDLGYRLFAWAPCSVSLVAQSGNWWLYEKDPRCNASNPAP
jgi:hypothetical protein